MYVGHISIVCCRLLTALRRGKDLFCHFWFLYEYYHTECDLTSSHTWSYYHIAGFSLLLSNLRCHSPCSVRIEVTVFDSSSSLSLSLSLIASQPYNSVLADVVRAACLPLTHTAQSAQVTKGLGSGLLPLLFTADGQERYCRYLWVYLYHTARSHALRTTTLMSQRDQRPTSLSLSVLFFLMPLRFFPFAIINFLNDTHTDTLIQVQVEKIRREGLKRRGRKQKLLLPIARRSEWRWGKGCVIVCTPDIVTLTSQFISKSPRSQEWCLSLSQCIGRRK